MNTYKFTFKICILMYSFLPIDSFTQNKVVNKTLGTIQLRIHYNSSVEMPCVFKDLTINGLQEAAIDSPTSTCSTVGMVEVKVIDGPVAVGQSVKLNALLKTNDHTIEVYIQESDGTLQVVLK